MAIDPTLYGVEIKKVSIEGEKYFEAKIKEFPDVREYGDTFQEAYNLAIEAIESAEKLLKGTGKTMPQPMVERAVEHSGRITLRVAKDLHRELASAAEMNGVSLNAHINTLLSFNQGVLVSAKILQDSGLYTWGFNSAQYHYEPSNGVGYCYEEKFQAFSLGFDFNGGAAVELKRSGA